MQYAFLSIQFIFWLHFICYILTVKISITICTLSSQKDLIFPVQPLSDKFLINALSPFSNTAVNGPLLLCLAMFLRFLQDEFVDTVLHAWLIWFLKSCTNLKCVSCCLVCGFKWVQLLFWAFVQIKGSMANSLWWSAWYNCMRRLIYEHGLSKISFEFHSKPSTLQLSTYSFSQFGHYTRGDKVLYEVFLCYKALTGV